MPGTPSSPGGPSEFTDLGRTCRPTPLRWCSDVANQRPLPRRSTVSLPRRCSTPRRRSVLLALPRHPFELARWSTATVNPDIHVKVGKALYSRALALHRQSRSTPGKERTTRRDLLGRRARQDPRPHRAGQADRLRPTTRRRRSPSSCAPRRGAAAGRPSSARRWPRWSESSWR